MAAHIDAGLVSDITCKEKQLTGENYPVKGGPTAQAQKHFGDEVDGRIVADVTKAKRKISDHPEGPVKGGPAALVQSVAFVCLLSDRTYLSDS